MNSSPQDSYDQEQQDRIADLRAFLTSARADRDAWEAAAERAEQRAWVAEAQLAEVYRCWQPLLTLGWAEAMNHIRDLAILLEGLPERTKALGALVEAALALANCRNNSDINVYLNQQGKLCAAADAVLAVRREVGQKLILDTEPWELDGA